eukprot:29930-Pelagococcus_subviridis.AAC.4
MARSRASVNGFVVAPGADAEDFLLRSGDSPAFGALAGPRVAVAAFIPHVPARVSASSIAPGSGGSARGARIGASSHDADGDAMGSDAPDGSGAVLTFSSLSFSRAISRSRRGRRDLSRARASSTVHASRHARGRSPRRAHTERAERRIAVAKRRVVARASSRASSVRDREDGDDGDGDFDARGDVERPRRHPARAMRPRPPLAIARAIARARALARRRRARGRGRRRGR